jgi:putative redox protein
MAEDTHRSVTIERLSEGVYLARNARGDELRFGSSATDAFSPVELLLAAIAGCSAVDVDVVTGRRARATRFTATAEAEKVRDEVGSILKDVRLTYDVRFPDGEAGDEARKILPRAAKASHDRTCTVSRTVEAGTPISVAISPDPDRE